MLLPSTLPVVLSCVCCGGCACPECADVSYVVLFCFLCVLLLAGEINALKYALNPITTWCSAIYASKTNGPTQVCKTRRL